MAVPSDREAHGGVGVPDPGRPVETKDASPGNEAAGPDANAPRVPGATLGVGAPWQTLGDRISAVLGVGQALVLTASVVVVITEIVLRYFLNSDFTQSGEVLTLTFTWLVFLGIPRAIWRDTSPRLGFTRSYPDLLARLSSSAASGATLALLAVELWSYVVLWPTQVSTTLSPLNLPAYAASIVVPIGAIFGMALLLVRLLGQASRGGMTSLAGAVIGAALAVVPVVVALPPEAVALAEIAVLLALDCPIAVALGVAGAAMIVNGNLGSGPAVSEQLLGPMQNLALLAIPLFMLMGGLFAYSRLAGDLSRFVQSVLGWLPGGTGVACVATSAVFANISGSAIADTAAIGSVYIPELIRRKYPPEDAAALQAAAGVIGVVFPPAIAMILFASVANINVIPVFKAVVVPGMMIVAVMSVIAVLVARRRSIPSSGQFRIRDVASSLPSAVPVLLVPLILDGGIFSGIFTPAEAGAVAVIVTAVAIGLRRGMTWRMAARAVEQGLDNTTIVMFILTSVALLDYGFTTSGLGAQVTATLAFAGRSPLLTLVAINIIFIIVHEFVDAGPSILVLVPLVLPAALAAGVSPLQLAAVVAINSTIGAVLPPIGVNLYVSSRIAGVDAREALRRVWPYVGGSVLVLVLVTLVPTLSLWLAGAGG